MAFSFTFNFFFFSITGVPWKPLHELLTVVGFKALSNPVTVNPDQYSRNKKIMFEFERIL
jgi:hypothetical protein